MTMTRTLAAVLLALCVSACAQLPAGTDRSGSGPEGAGPPKDRTGAAPGPSAALLQESREYAAAGEYPAAAASLERAVRIEPANPWLWIELARVHFASGNLAQAESHARKALSLAGPDDAAREAAEELLSAVAAG